MIGMITYVCVQTADSDVIPILVAVMTEVIAACKNLELQVEFGTGSNKSGFSQIRHLKTWEILGDFDSNLIHLFHEFTGCNSTSAFYRKVNHIFFKHWMTSASKDDITKAFYDLSWEPQETEKDVATYLDTVDKFVFSVYKGYTELSIDATCRESPRDSTIKK